MFTARKIGHTDDKQTQRRTVVIQFTDGVIEYSKPFSFNLTATVDEVKKVVSAYLDEINAEVSVLPDNTTDFSVTEATPDTPTQAELDKREWDSDFAKLEKVKRLIDCGVLTGNEAAITTLRNKVKDGFKPGYLN